LRRRGGKYFTLSAKARALNRASRRNQKIGEKIFRLPLDVGETPPKSMPVEADA